MNRSTQELFDRFYDKIELLDKRLTQCEYILEKKDNNVSQISITGNIIDDYNAS